LLAEQGNGVRSCHGGAQWLVKLRALRKIGYGVFKNSIFQDQYILQYMYF